MWTFLFLVISLTFGIYYLTPFANRLEENYCEQTFGQTYARDLDGSCREADR